MINIIWYIKWNARKESMFTHNCYSLTDKLSMQLGWVREALKIRPIIASRKFIWMWGKFRIQDKSFMYQNNKINQKKNVPSDVHFMFACLFFPKMNAKSLISIKHNIISAISKALLSPTANPENHVPALGGAAHPHTSGRSATKKNILRETPPLRPSCVRGIFRYLRWKVTTGAK